jgi:hypothetical protein
MPVVIHFAVKRAIRKLALTCTSSRLHRQVTGSSRLEFRHEYGPTIVTFLRIRDDIDPTEDRSRRPTGEHHFTEVG